jgi:predicted small metal-binding protein
MKYIECRKISGVECEYIAKGDYPENVVDTLIGHMKRHHSEFVENLTERQMKILQDKIVENLKIIN